MRGHVPVEPFHPGEYIKDEIDARGWSQDDLASIMNCSRQTVMRLINGTSGVTAETALALSGAFGTSAEMWMDLQTAYELSKAKVEDRDIARRAAIFSKTPVRDLKRRGWIPEVDETDELESAVCRFLQIPTINDETRFTVAARKSTSYSAADTPEQIAWFARAHQLAPAAPATTYDEKRLPDAIAELQQMTSYADDIRRVPKVLSDYGIRLLLIEHLPRSRVDGIAFWINDGASPVIALSLRFDRIDNFWHNLFHEIVHIKYRHDPRVDVNLFSEPEADADPLPENEQIANAEACNYLFPAERLESFIARHRKLCYAPDIVRAAQARKVHPGILVGQLHGRGVLDFKFQRKFLVKVREHILGQALTDGWGHRPALS